MRDIDILDELIKQDAFEQPQKSKFGKLLVKLCESQEPNSTATIHNLPPDARIIKVDDKFVAPKGIFNGDKGECKRADYVVISAEKRRILYIEMKLTKGDPGQIVRQLQGAQCFIKYCQEIVKAFWGEREFLKDYKNRFISIAHTNSILKERTRISRNAGPHDSPRKAMRIDYPNRLEFNELAG